MIEPNAVISVSTPVIRSARHDPERPLKDYQAYIARRFGNGKLPSWSELARRENRAMLRTRDNQPKSDHTEHSRAVMAEIRKAKGDATMRELLAAMKGTMTTTDVLVASGMSRRKVEQALDRALEQKLVFKGKIKNVSVWTRAEDIAMPVAAE